MAMKMAQVGTLETKEDSTAPTAIIESIFTIPGVGLYMLNGINAMDFPVTRGCVIVLSLFSAFSVLLMDLVYAFVDPRIKAQYAGGKKR